MPAEELFSYGTLFGFLFVLARVSGVIAFLPLAGFRATPEPARVVLALAIAVILFPQWHTAGGDWTLSRITAGVACELGLGLALGLSVAVITEGFQMAAQIISIQAGFGYASTIDPTSGADSTVLITIAQLTAGLLFFVSGADRIFLRGIAESLRVCPPESFTLNRAWAQALMQFGSTIFVSGLRLAAPVAVLLLVADITMAVLSRLQPQLQLLTFTLPLKLGLVMLLMAATLRYYGRFFEAAFGASMHVLDAMLRHP